MPVNNSITLRKPLQVSLAELRAVYQANPTVTIDESLWAGVRRASDVVRSIVGAGKAVYGINTGFGLLAQTRIRDGKLKELQRNLVLSHSAGIGDNLSPRIVRLIIFLKIVGLAQGHSGVRREVIELLLAFMSHDITPCIPEKGSVGASGDLAPLAHLASALIGVGDVTYQGKIMPAEQALASIGCEPLVLEAKEGLALLNGTQVSTGLAIAALFETENLFAAAVVAGSISVDGLTGSMVPFEDRIHALRRQPGQRLVAQVFRSMLEGSGILGSHADCGKVQDPYSLRCQPQVMGACLDIMNYAAGVLEREANAVTDNPLIFEDTLEALSGGNFHAEPVAFAADVLALAIAEIGSISERRTALLVDPSMSNGLPAFLVEDSGLNSGFMIAQVSAAALVSENKGLAHPASVDSIPTSANQEDHVSMATYASRRLHTMAENSANVIAIELLAACQAVEFRAPHVTSAALRRVLEEIRSHVPRYDVDRPFAPDIKAVLKLVRQGDFYRFASGVLPSGAKPDA